MAGLADVTKKLEKGNSMDQRQHEDVVAGLELVAETIQAGSLTKEEKLEQGKYQSRVVELLEVIAGAEKGGAAKVGAPEGGGDAGIGLLGGLLGAALGGLVGAIAGWAKAVKKVFDVLTPNKIAEPIRNFFGRVRNFFVGVGETFANMLKNIKSAMSEGPIGKAIAGLKNIGGTIAEFFRPLTDAVKSMKGTGEGIGKMLAPIKNGIGRIFGFFRGLGSSLSGFTKMFSAVFKIVGKIFYPLTLIMTAWETVKGAFEGYAEDGFIGGILGGIEGLVNSLIMMPLDLIKGAVSWIAGFLGFENVEATLDSFSFEDMFSSVIDAIKDFIFAIPGYLVEGFDWLMVQLSDFGGWIDENLITPIFNAFEGAWQTVADAVSGLGTTIYETLIQPVVDLFDEYVVQPLADLFAPIGEWFSSKMRMLMGFLEDFGIPAISFDIPLYGAVEIGPWYPFRTEGSDAGTMAIEAEDVVNTVVEGDTAIETSQSYTKSVGSGFDATGDETVLTDDVTQILVADSRSVENADGASYVAHDAFLEFDARSGQANYNGENVDKDVYMAGKLAAMDGATVQEIELAMAREAAYNKLSWWNAGKALAGYDPIELLAQQEGQTFSVADLVPGAGQTGEVINQASVDVADAQRSGTGGTTTVVNAPQTVNSNTQHTASIRRPARNDDSSARMAQQQMVEGFS